MKSKEEIQRMIDRITEIEKSIGNPEWSVEDIIAVRTLNWVLGKEFHPFYDYDEFQNLKSNKNE